jgi:type II secretory ATPase GspE/PulE/Tfp pilus assembly ATPase PilB-like protein
MLSSEDKPTDTGEINKKTPSTTQKWEQESNTPQELLSFREQTFNLIETILSFEVCLYHQILPLKLEENTLLLGMVNPEDTSALDYVSRILSYINSTMVKTLITPDAHRNLLSAYLNYKNTSQSPVKELPKTWAELSKESESTDTNQPFESNLPHTPQSHFAPQRGSKLQRGEPTPQTTSNRFFATPLTAIGKDSFEVLTGNLPVLLVPPPEQLTPFEELTTLPPKKLLQELLGRVLAGGIGRLYLERQPYQGRILWSDNGVLQSVLEKLPLSIFQGVLNELKRFAALPITTLVEPKQIEKECLYQQSRLLLRLRIMPGMYGEEATLQVLRGAALKFHQQQQLARLGRDALGISQQLSYKLHELQERLVVNRNVNTGQLDAFNTLSQLLDNLDNQIKTLTKNPEGE